MQAQLAEHLRLEVHVLHVPRSLIRFVLPKGETMKTQATRLVHPILLIIAITSGSMAVARGDGGRTPDSVQNVERAKALLDSWSGQQDVLRDAMKLIMRAIGQNNEYPPAYLEYARYQLKSGYLSAKEVGSGPNTYMLAQYKPGTLGMARRTLQRALAIDPGYADGYILLGHIEFSNRRPDKAREALAIADSLASTTNPWQDLYWADVLLAEGDYEGAVSRYRTVAESDTENLKALLAANEGLIRHYTWRGDYAAADTTFTRMVALSPENAWLRGNYATFLTGKLGRYDDAIEQASEALRIMDYGVGRQILAFALYRKWAEVLATPGSTPENPQEYFDVASQLYPDLTQVMVYSASNNHGENLAKALIAKGISVDAAVGNGSTALQIAANTGRHEVVSYLLGLGADPNVSTTNGWTPLLGAADEGDYETVRLLLDADADVTAKLGSQDAISLAKARGHHDVAELIRAFKKQDGNK
jgi:tetratricopeptide (TPR) repeat protein